MTRRFIYLFCFSLLLAIEFSLATCFKHWQWVRGNLGDVLVTAMLYCLARALYTASRLQTALAILLFAYLIEFLQYFHFASALGFAPNSLGGIVLGNTFSEQDLVMYTIGTICIYQFDTRFLKA